MKNLKRVVLISAELSNLSKETNMSRTVGLEAVLSWKGYKFTKALGSYKGSQETSFVVDASEDIVNNLLEIAKTASQESILVVNEDRKASLLYPSGKSEFLGEMIHIEPSEAIDSYTLVNGNYFKVK